MTPRARPAPSRVPVLFQQMNSLILLDQIQTLDKSRLARRLGVVADGTLSAALAALCELFEA